MPFPPISFLFDAGELSLQDLILTARNRSANLRKVVTTEIDAWIKEEAVAMMAEFMRDNREALLSRREIEVPPHKVEFMPEREKKRA